MFYVIILTNSGCKNRYFFQINQTITYFLSKVFAIFTEFHYFCTRKAAPIEVIPYRKEDIPNIII